MRAAPLTLAFTVVYLVWGSTYLAIRIAVEDLPPLAMASVRFALAGLIALGWAKLRAPTGLTKPAPRRGPRWRDALVPGLLFFAFANGAIVWAEARGLPSGTAALLIATVPLWVALLDRLTAPRGAVALGLRRGVGLALGFAGTAILVRATPQGVDPFTAVVVIVGSMGWALGSVLVARRARRCPIADEHPFAAPGRQMIVGGVGAAVASLVLGEPMPDFHAVTAAAAAAFVYLVLIGSLLAFSAYTYLLTHVPAPRVATYAYVNPVVAVLLGLLVGEPLGIQTVLAMAVVLAAVALTLAPTRQLAKGSMRPSSLRLGKG